MAEEKLAPLFLFDDEPVRAHTDDHLALKPFSSMIAAAALGNRGPFNIGVFSGWGQGKTSVLRQARSLIEAQNKPHIVTAWVNAWQYEHEEHPIVPLLAVIINEISKTLEERKTALEKVGEGTGKLLKDLSRALRSIAYGFSAKTNVKIPGFAGLEVGFVAKDMIDRDEKLSADRDPLLDQSLYYHAYDRLEKFREQLEKTKLTDQPRIVVFIDDLDRCQPDKALHLLESLKLVLAQPGFIFVLGVDRQVIDAFLTKRYHDEFGIKPEKLHGKQYMDKIIQLPLDLPHHQSRFEKYIGDLIHDPKRDHTIPQEFRNLFADEKAGPAFISALAAGCSRCPRTLIRTLNYLLTDLFLRENEFFNAEKDPFGKDHGEFLQFAAVSRITRITFGSEHERLYRRLVDDERACEEMAQHFMGPRLIETPPEPKRTGPAPPPAIFNPVGSSIRHEFVLQRASEIYEEVEIPELFRTMINSSDALEELFLTSLGQTWLKEHEKRQAIEGFLSTRQEPDQDQNSLQIINKAIREALDLKEDIPLSDDIRLKVNSLKLEGTQVSDLTLLSTLTSLQELNLLGTQVSDLSPLKNLTSLETLTLSGTQTHDLKPLGNLTNLNRLFLSLAPVRDLTPLSTLTNLGLLNLNRTPVSDLTPLKSLANLRSLSLTATQVKDVTPLKSLANLRFLSLNRTQVSDVRPLKGLANLQSLNLAGSQVRDVKPLEGLASLLELGLANTPAAADKEAMVALRKALPKTSINA